jgi:two-component system response regulator MprA
MVIGMEPSVAQEIRDALEAAGFEVALAPEHRDGVRVFLASRPAAVIVRDLMPGVDGWDVARRLREMSNVPIVFISERRDVFSMERALQVGDAYLTPPWNWPHLLARLRSLLRRAASTDAERLVFSDGRLEIDFVQRQVAKDGRPVSLTDTEFKLLSHFVHRPNQVLTYAELLNQVWGHTQCGAKSHVSLYVRYLRKKLEDHPSDPAYFVTEWGVGYSFRTRQTSGSPHARVDGDQRASRPPQDETANPKDA